MISAKIVADSSCNGHRITSMLVTMPRIILAEFNTHRMLSRNSASSRAIPFKKMVETVTNNPFVPIAWQKDHPGMQGTEYFTRGEETGSFTAAWLRARDNAIREAEYLQSGCNGFHVTKQMCNRLLEQWMWTTVLVTATEWENFFALRAPQYECLNRHTGQVEYFRSWKDYCNKGGYSNSDLPADYTVLERLQVNKGQAEIHMMAVAEAMWDALQESKPRELKPGEWHIPYGDQIDEMESHKLTSYVADYGGVHSSEVTDYLREQTELKIKIATARCARTSYTVLGEEGKPANYQKDIELHDRLAASGHWSPMEHCARAMTEHEYQYSQHTGWANENRAGDNLPETRLGWCKNFRGWIQYRALFPNENKM